MDSSTSDIESSGTTQDNHVGLPKSPCGKHLPIASSSSLKPPIMRRQTTSARFAHRRRASQPAMSYSTSSRSTAFSLEDSDAWLSSSGNDDGNTSSEEDERVGQRVSLDYLDLSLSLPYTLTTLRAQILAHCSQLEQKIRTLYHNPATANPGLLDAHFADSFYTHLHALKEDLQKLAHSLPSTPLPISFSSFPTSAAQLSSLSTFSPLANVDYVAALNSVTTHLPASGVNLLERVQTRFEVLQDSVRAITLRDCFYWSRSAADDEDDTGGTSMTTPGDPSLRRLSITSSQMALSRQFESIFETIKHKGEQVRVNGHARAASMGKAAKVTEEMLYAAAVELAKGGQRLIQYEHLPTLWKNNEHILSGYRFIPSNDIGALLKSTFQIHNETGNIMTHLIGALIVTPLFWPSKDNFDDYTTPMDRMVQSIYLIAALKCLILSVSWHVMAGCSNACLFERFACVDYTGIAWLVAASVWTLVYNAFYCQPNLAMFYSLTTLIVGFVGAVVPWAAWFNDRNNKPIRIAIFLTMCFTGVGPFIHASLSHGLIKTTYFFSPILPSVASYVFGLIFYATQFPERIAPGKFDVVGHAHQIWHISIVVAILLHYRATFIWHQGRFDFSCAINPLQQNSPSSATVAALNSVTDGMVKLTNQLTGNLFSESSSSTIQKAADLNIADDIVHGWRISAGRVGDGMVGRVWDWCVDRILATF
ncbi:hypothetical protein CBS101457_004284 [Exobasidium rhododendri]|nr:hypothetical protein CBS101457_004284 [Exobasidium rhododendri]